MRGGFHLFRMALRHERFTDFRTRVRLNEYMVMPFQLTNALATVQHKINRILLSLLGISLEINTEQAIDKDDCMVVVACIDDILIATKESIEKHHSHVSKVFQLLKDNHMCIECDTCIFNATEVMFLGCLVNGTGIEMDLENAKAIVDWP